MTTDWVEWDDHNLEHATRRASAEEIEQVIRNATKYDRHRRHPDRVVVRASTDGGRELVVVARLVSDGLRPITAWEV